MRTIRFTSAVLSALLFLACGPEQSSFDESAQERLSRRDKSIAVQKRAVGTYRGTIRIGGNNREFILKIRIMSTFVPNGSTMEILEIPGLVGVASPRAADFSAFSFDRGSYDEDKNQLSLYGSASGTPAGFHWLEGKILGDHIVGEYLSGAVNSQVDFVRIGD